jgi:uncharacterized membrane protein
MATDRPLEPTGPIEHGTTRAGRWLRHRRIRIALWIAVLEGIVVAISHDYSRWTIIAIAIIVLGLYVVVGRRLESDTGRQLFWIAGLSQSLAVLVVIFSFIVVWISLIVAGIFAAIALLFLLNDRG